MKQWYEQLFAESYDKESFTTGTIGEVDFIEQEIDFDKTKTILDIGCGTGRHAIELAKRDYTVTGVDLSEAQLKRAKHKVAEAGIKVNFLKRDARKLDYEKSYDVAIMICEGAFSLMETDEMNFQILENAKNALRENCKFIFTCLNALFPLYHSVKDFLNENSDESVTSELSFDLKTFREHSTFDFVDDSGKKKTITCNERYFAPSEISWYLKTLNFRKINIYGCEIGKFSRAKKLTTDDFEMLVVAEK